MATDIEIFIGTSQDFLLSFKVTKTDEDEHVLERYIAHRCHNGSIISMDTKGRYLATGGGDDRIVVIDLKLNRDVHEIVRHEGSINSLLFTNKGSDLLSGSDDGQLVATTVGSWKPINIWKKPHTGKAVLKVCLHPSDKFALTLGKDGTLRGWDMFKGKQINTFNTKDLSDANITLDNVEMSPDGLKFAMSGEKTVAITSLIGEEPYDEPTLKSRVTSMCWLDGQNILIGLENGSVEWLNVKTSEQISIPSVHTRRIKGMHYLNGFLGTICSSGAISLWATAIPQKKLTLICSTTDESIRPTCIKLIDITENRYKEKFNVDTEKLNEGLPRSVKNSRPISTIGKVIVEADGNENSDISTIQNASQQTTNDDTDTDTEIVPEKTRKRTKSSVKKSFVASALVPTDIETGHAKVLKKKKSSVTPSDIASTNPSHVIEQSGVTKSRKTPPTPIVASAPAKLATKKRTAVLPVDVESSTSIDVEHTRGRKKKAEKSTVQKPIVVRSPNLDDDFESPKTKRPKKIQKSSGKAVAESGRRAVKSKQHKSNLNEDSQDIPTGRGSQKKLNLSQPTLADATPIRKRKTKSTTPMSCPPVQQNHNSQQSNRKNRKLEVDTTKPVVKNNTRRMTMDMLD